MTYPTSSSASDVWSLRDVYKAEAGGDWPVRNIFDESAELGTPDRTVTTIPAAFGPDGNGTQDFTYAVDISNFDSADNGVLFEMGGQTFGFSIQMNGGDLQLQSSGITDTTADMSAFDGQTGTLYLSIDYGNKYDVYWVTNANVTLVKTGSITSDYEGTSLTGVGDSDTPGDTTYNFGTYYGTYTGTITEFRSWANTYYDFSTV